MPVNASASDSKGEVASPPAKKSWSKSPGVRVIGGRVYESDNGKTCHQCRQKTRDFAASCKNLKGDKLCTIKYCHKCLMNRYGEKAEEVAFLDDWKCPKCRGICNFSFCMKKKGHQPTGILVRTAKENGFSSVSELLQVEGPENFSYNRIAKDVGVSSKHPKEELAISSPRKLGKENSFDGKMDLTSHPQNLIPISVEIKSKKKRREGLHELNNGNGYNDCGSKKGSQKKPKLTDEVSKTKLKIKEKLKKVKNEVDMEEMESTNKKVAKKHEDGKASNDIKNHSLEIKNEKTTKSCKISKCIIEVQRKQVDEIPLPLATLLTTVAGIELRNEVAGDALQFFEFCAAFNEALDLKKGQLEAVIREIVFGRGGRRSQGSLLVQFNIKLLSLILEVMGEKSSTLSAANGKNSWLKYLGKCVSSCNLLSAEFPADCFDRGNERYDMFDASQKFKLLNFLCDKALNTIDLRSWIDKQNSEFLEREKVAKEKEKLLKQKVQDEVAKAIIATTGASLSISEHEEIVLQIRKEAAQAHAETLEAMGMAPKRMQRSDAVRTDPILLDVHGHAFWRLKGCKDEPAILLQDISTGDSSAPKEKWFVYEAEQKEGIEKYISSLRTKRLRVQKFGEASFFGDNKETTS